MPTTEWMRHITASDPRVSAADLHVHSKHSDRPSEWFLRRIGAPECFVEPHEVYAHAKRQGMDFVTITDHNSIDGALSIADRADTFISSELTTYFPEDRCKIHCLVFDITEEQFAELDAARENIYDFQRYLVGHNILHAVAHPLFAVNDKLTLNHVEKILLLFNRFEAINGTRHPRASQLVNALFRTLTPDLIGELANCHGILPHGDKPWEKTFTGGSDDHSGVYTASAYTVTPFTKTAQEYLQNLRSGMHECAGVSGTSLKLAHSFYNIAYGYYKNRFLASGNGKTTLLGSLLQQAVEQTTRGTTYSPGVLRSTVTNILWGWKKRKMSCIERMLVEEFTQLVRGKNTDHDDDIHRASNTKGDQQSFELACHVSQNLGCAFFRKFIAELQQGSLIECLQTFASMGPVALSVAPYVAAFGTQHRDEALLRKIAGRFSLGRHTAKHVKRAWVTDTFKGTDEIRLFATTAARQACQKGYNVLVITCNDEVSHHTHAADGCKVFQPIDTFNPLGRDALSLAFPPFLEMIEYLEHENFSEIIISTPGPVGITALAAGRLLGLPMVAVHHMDYVECVTQHTEDDAVGQIVSRYLRWFYAHMNTVYTFSEDSRKDLMAYGVDKRILSAPLSPDSDTPDVSWIVDMLFASDAPPRIPHHAIIPPASKTDHEASWQKMSVSCTAR